jgi:hypothetical protein
MKESSQMANPILVTGVAGCIGAIGARSPNCRRTSWRQKRKDPRY